MLLRGTIVNRTYGNTKTYILTYFLLTILGPIYYSPTEYVIPRNRPWSLGLGSARKYVKSDKTTTTPTTTTETLAELQGIYVRGIYIPGRRYARGGPMYSGKTTALSHSTHSVALRDRTINYHTQLA